MAFVIRPAERKKAKLRLSLIGPSGSGKTTTAVRIAHGIGGKIVAIDTERHRADLCEKIVPFSVMDFDEPYTPERYIEAIEQAEKSGADTIIIDSLSHEWSGTGGILEIQNQVAQLPKQNTWTAWAKVTPRHKALVECMTRSTAHIIATMRTKTKWVQETDDNGKARPVKMGLEPIQKDDIEFEFMVTMLMDNEHKAYAVTDHTGLFENRIITLPGEEIGVELLEWLNTGVDPGEVARIKKEIHDITDTLKLKWGEIVETCREQKLPFPTAPIPEWHVSDYTVALESIKKLKT